MPDHKTVLAAKKLAGSDAKTTVKQRYSCKFHRPKTLRLLRTPKFSRKSVPKVNPLDSYAILKYPLTTESAMKKIEDNNTLVFIVDVLANKSSIKEAVKSLYDIQTAKVNTLIRYNFGSMSRHMACPFLSRIGSAIYASRTYQHRGITHVGMFTIIYIYFVVVARAGLFRVLQKFLLSSPKHVLRTS